MDNWWIQTYTHGFDPLLKRAYKTLHVSLSSMEIGPSLLKDHVFVREVEGRIGSSPWFDVYVLLFLFIEWIRQNPLYVKAIDSLEFMCMTSRMSNPIDDWT